MKAGRRHESLIPLSREHHYGLVVSLKIHRELEKHIADTDWLNDRANKVIRFFDSDLRAHFRVEEEIVFPAMSGIEEARATVEQLIADHRNLERLVDRLRQASEVEAGPLLRQFADVLETHIHTEERVLFPCYEQNLTARQADKVKTAILESIGTAMQPKQPDLLE